MTGDQSIRAMRKAGHKPTHVWVSDFPDALLDGLTVKVHGDTPETIDLRFLVGCTAIVEGDNPQRVARIEQACKDAQASRVIASTHRRTGNGRDDVVQISDSEGVMTWQA